MVTLHKFKVKLFTAEWADVLLLLPYCQFDVLWESTQVEITLITCQYDRKTSAITASTCCQRVVRVTRPSMKASSWNQR